MTREAFYFGARRCIVHQLHQENTRGPVNARDVAGLPWTVYDLDAGLLESWGQKECNDGRVHWTYADGWFAFCWWDRTGDTRAESNSGLYVKGFSEGERIQAFQYVCDKFPDIISRQGKNLTLQNLEAKCQPSSS
jgi:hypothetical protein